MVSVIESFFLGVGNALPRLSCCDGIRYLFYRFAGVRFRGRCTFWGPITLRPIGAAANLSFGAKCFINTDVRFACADTICFGSRVQIGPGVSFETASHGLLVRGQQGRGMIKQPITVEDDVWIGAGAIVLQGVTIGRGAVVAARALVNRDVQSYTLVAGVPAREMKKLSSND